MSYEEVRSKYVGKKSPYHRASICPNCGREWQFIYYPPVYFGGGMIEHTIGCCVGFRVNYQKI